MNLKSTITGAMFVALNATQALPAELTAKQLNVYCADENGLGALTCAAYISGFVDGLVTGPAMSLEMTQGQVCLPGVIDNVAARRYVKQFFAQHPEVLSEFGKDGGWCGNVASVPVRAPLKVPNSP